jgi:hypothetical protein
MTKEDYMNHIKEDELRNREPDIYDIEDAYEEGYREAVAKTCKWLNNFLSDYMLNGYLSSTECDFMITHFRKAMKE